MILIFILAIFYSQGKDQVWGINAQEYITSYFVILTILVLYRLIVILLPALFSNTNTLILFLTLDLFYIGSTYFYIIFLNDFFANANNWESTARKLYIAMVVMVIEAMYMFIQTLIHTFLTGNLFLFKVKTLV